MRKSFYALLLLVALAAPVLAEQLTMKRALELALSNSSTVSMAIADERRSESGYREARNTFVPQLIFGSGLGYSIGYPLTVVGSAPSIFEVNAQSFLWNPAQREFIRSARTEWNASALNTEDQRNQVALETAVTYVQLDRNEEKIAVLEELLGQARNAEQITKERYQQGINSQVDVTRASLTAARARLRLADAKTSSDVLRQRLSQLTGLPAQSIQTARSSVPAYPKVAASETLASRAIESNATVKLAEQRALSAEQRARGEHKALLPSVAFGATYGLFARYNNYEDYFLKFQRNNATIGVQIRYPFMDFAQRARASAADAEALRARRQVEVAREQVTSQALQLQRVTEQLSAATEVAELELQLAQVDRDAAQARTDTGQATILDERNAEMGISDKKAAAIDAAFNLDKARLQLLSITGDLRKWAGVQ